MFVVDTNVLFYSINGDSPFHVPCRDLMRKLRIGEGGFFLTWGILYEFLRLLTHPRVLPSSLSPDEAWGIVNAICRLPGAAVLNETPRHREILGTLVTESDWIRGNLIFDARTVVLMREHGIKTIYTYDKDFLRFPEIEVIVPEMPAP